MASPLWQTVLRFDPSKIAPEIAVRNTVGIVVPLVIGLALGNIPAGVVGSLGALNVCYSDSRDPYAARGRRMLLASLLVGVAVAVGALSAHYSATAVIAATLWAFAIGMIVVLGPKAGDLGAVTLVTLLIFTARNLTLTEALQSGAIAFCGGLIQTLLSVAFWPVKPYAPEHRIIARLYQDLAQISVSPAGSAAAPPATAAITEAQQALASLALNHSVESERLMFLLAQAERIRLSILTLRRLAHRLNRDAAGQQAAACIADVLMAAAETLRVIGQQPGSLHSVNEKVTAFHGLPPASGSTMLMALRRDALRHVDALAAQLRAAAAPKEHQRRATASPSRDPFSRLALVQANLTLKSTVFRHALRMAVCIGIGTTVGRSLGLQRSYWLPMTIAIVLKPDFTATFSRGILRIAGTFMGLVIATALFHILHTGPLTDILLVTTFALFGRWIGPANYGLFVSALSAIAVLYIAMGGSSPIDAIMARALNTALGGAIALLAYWIWPTWEHTQVNTLIADMLVAYRRYLAAIVTGPATAIAAERLPGRLARSNAAASVARLASEPGTRTFLKHQELANCLNSILVSSHSFARAAMALESAVGSTRPAALRQFGADADVTLGALAEAVRNSTAPPRDLPDLRQAWITMERSEPHTLVTTETDRIATSLNTLREQVSQLNRKR